MESPEYEIIKRDEYTLVYIHAETEGYSGNTILEANLLAELKQEFEARSIICLYVGPESKETILKQIEEMQSPLQQIDFDGMVASINEATKSVTDWATRLKLHEPRDPRGSFTNSLNPHTGVNGLPMKRGKGRYR